MAVKTGKKTAKAGGKKVAAKQSTKKTPAKVAPKKVATKKSASAKISKARAPKKGAASKGAAGFPEQVRDAIKKLLVDKQAEQISTIDLRGQSPLYDYMIVASGRNPRQLQGLASNLRVALEKLGVQRLRIEGATEANWVLVDAGDVIVHLFRPEVRAFYNLDQFYGAA